MFDFFRRNRAPKGPYEFGADTEVACSASELFALLDLHDPGYWKRQMGDRVEQVAADRFEMVVSQLPDVTFTLSVTEYEPGSSIAFQAASEPKMGQLDRATERYVVTEIEPGLSRVELAMTAYFQKELGIRSFEDENVKLALSCFNAVEKIRIFAEQGEGGVRVADRQFVVGFDNADCTGS